MTTPPHVMQQLQDLQNAAEQAVRRAAKDHAPADAGNVMIAREAVKKAWQDAYERALLEVTGAFALALQDDEGFDIDTFTEVLADMKRGRQMSIDLVPAHLRRPGRTGVPPGRPVDRGSGTGGGRAMTDPGGIHPRTRSDVKAGVQVITRDAFGRFREATATTGVEWGRDFFVVWIERNAGDDAVPWPAEDVWLPGDEPKEEGNDGS